MRLVLDTNVVVSALLWGGNPERVIVAAGEGVVELFTSAALLAELAGLLGRAKLAAQLKRKGLPTEEVLARYLELAQLIDAAPVEEPRLRDLDDAAVLACAVAARANAIVSGDADLQTLVSYRGIDILSPAQALVRINL